MKKVKFDKDGNIILRNLSYKVEHDELTEEIIKEVKQKRNTEENAETKMCLGDHKDCPYYSEGYKDCMLPDKCIYEED